jgi:hypothetical protein
LDSGYSKNPPKHTYVNPASARFSFDTFEDEHLPKLSKEGTLYINNLIKDNTLSPDNVVKLSEDQSNTKAFTAEFLDYFKVNKIVLIDRINNSTTLVPDDLVVIRVQSVKVSSTFDVFIFRKNN